MKDIENESIILAGDIGGTKTSLGLFTKGKRRPRLKISETYPSREAPDLRDIIERFLGAYPVPVAGACFGIAGPVVNGRCKTTNLPWDVSEVRIKKRFKLKQVRLINDVSATALAIPLLNSRELAPLNSARPLKGNNLALVAPGTGLGQALLMFNKGQYFSNASEGGHADFCPNTRAEVRLWEHLHDRFGHVSIERVLSGPGLLNIYSWLRDTGQYREPAWLKRKIKEQDPAKAISETAMNQKHPMCVKTLDIFVSILGAVSGNLALTAITTGGVYLGGGIPPRILPRLKEGRFMEAFVNKGRFREMLEKIPVRVILNDRAALLGAASYAFESNDSK